MRCPSPSPCSLESGVWGVDVLSGDPVATDAAQLVPTGHLTLDDQWPQLAEPRQTSGGVNPESGAGVSGDSLHRHNDEHRGGSPKTTDEGGAGTVDGGPWELSCKSSWPCLSRGTGVSEGNEDRSQHNGGRPRERASRRQKGREVGAEPEQDRADPDDDDAEAD